MTKFAIEQKSIGSNYLNRALFVGLMLVQLPFIDSRPARAAQKRLVIHVPLQVKMHHHTHTVYSHIRSGESKRTVYKIQGYSSYGKGHQVASGDNGYDDGSDYDDRAAHYNHGRSTRQGHEGRHDYDSPSRGHGDIIFNHYSRNDEDVVEDYPFVDAFVDDINWI